MHRSFHPLLASTVALLALSCALPAIADEADRLFEQEEQAMQAAVERVAPSVVRIETIGGMERVGDVLLGTGPTTGLIVAPDGYIISSSFNFVQRPASILVTLPDGTRHPARVVANDRSRMLTLLKIDVDQSLPVPEAVSAEEMRVGQWSIAVGRAFDSPAPNRSVGIVSALERIWGKAIQTDAKVSPTNYGGPLVDIRGRVLGVLVPLSPTASGEVAGVEWYDSGIGFAIPLEHVERMLPRLREGEDLLPGLLGVSLRDDESEQAVIVACRVNSPAYKAGLEAGDVIVEIDGDPIARPVHLRSQLNRRYAGDEVHLVVLRGDERLQRQVQLVAELEPYQRPFLGVLPAREHGDADAGLRLRHVFSGSPADEANLLTDDLLIGLDGQDVADADAWRQRIASHEVGTTVRVTLKRGGERLETDVTLGTLPETLPAEVLSRPARPNAEQPAGERTRVGSFQLKVGELTNECLVYVPEGYDPQIPHGVVTWLHNAGGYDEAELLARWKPLCDQYDLILAAPRAKEGGRWTPDELEFIGKAIDELQTRYTVDPQRIVAYGTRIGGTLGLLLAFERRDLVRAVVAVEPESVAAVRPGENDPLYPLALYFAGHEDSPQSSSLAAAVTRLRAMKYPIIEQSLFEPRGDLDDEQLLEVVRWIDTLDRI